MPSKYGFINVEEEKALLSANREKGSALAKKISPIIIDLLQDLKEARSITADIKVNLDLVRKSNVGLQFGQWHLSNMEIELTGIDTLEPSSFPALSVRHISQFSKSSERELFIKILCEKTGCEIRYDFDRG